MNASSNIAQKVEAPATSGGFRPDTDSWCHTNSLQGGAPSPHPAAESTTRGNPPSSSLRTVARGAWSKRSWRRPRSSLCGRPRPRRTSRFLGSLLLPAFSIPSLERRAQTRQGNSCRHTRGGAMRGIRCARRCSLRVRKKTIARPRQLWWKPVTPEPEDPIAIDRFGGDDQPAHQHACPVTTGGQETIIEELTSHWLT